MGSPSITTQTVLLRRGLSVAELAPGTAALPWLDWGVLAWLGGGLSGLGSLCGGDEASKADGLGGEAGGGERVVRLRRGPGWGGKPERQMSHTQREADGGSGWARCRLVQRSGGGVEVSSAITPRGVSARARHQWLIEAAS